MSTDDSAADPYAVRRPGREDLLALAAFARLIWPDAPPDRLAQRWWWHGEDEPHCLVAVHRPSGDIAALCGERRVRLLRAGEVVPASSIFDWYVAPAHGGHALGRRLVEWSRRTHSVQYTTSVSNSAITAFTRLGFSAPCRLPLFFAPPPAVAAITALRKYPGTVAELSTGGDLADIDRLWAANASGSRVMMVRDAAQLHAHLQLAPQSDYRLLVCRRGADPLGYLLYRVLPRGSIRRLPWARFGLLVDFLTVPETPDALGALVGAAARDLTRQACAGMVMLATTAEHIAVLHRAGFVSAHLSVVGRALRGLGTDACHWSPAPLPDFLSGWHVTLADNDLDLVRG